MCETFNAIGSAARLIQQTALTTGKLRLERRSIGRALMHLPEQLRMREAPRAVARDVGELARVRACELDNDVGFAERGERPRIEPG